MTEPDIAGSNFDLATHWAETAQTAQSPEAQDIALKLAQIYAQLAAIEAQQQAAQLQSGILALLGQATSQAAETKPEGSPRLARAKITDNLIHDMLEEALGECPSITKDGSLLCSYISDEIGRLLS